MVKLQYIGTTVLIFEFWASFAGRCLCGPNNNKKSQLWCEFKLNWAYHPSLYVLYFTKGFQGIKNHQKSKADTS